MGWVDVHTHLNMLEVSPDEALRQAAEAGVTGLITIGTCPDDLPVVLKLAETYAPRVGCSLGVHPHEASLYDASVEAWIRQHAVSPVVVAIGETGLDYYYNHSSRDEQLAAFRAQMKLAEEFGLPVEIHTRDAEDDTMVILREFNGRVRGLLHCFTGTWALAEVGLQCGFNISISGVVTFKNADSLRDVVRRVPLERLHVETDAPFLAPIPHRGKKNVPAWVVHTAQKVAELKGVTLAELEVATSRNAAQLFPRLSALANSGASL